MKPTYPNRLLRKHGELPSRGAVLERFRRLVMGETWDPEVASAEPEPDPEPAPEQAPEPALVPDDGDEAAEAVEAAAPVELSPADAPEEPPAGRSDSWGSLADGSLGEELEGIDPARAWKDPPRREPGQEREPIDPDGELKRPLIVPAHEGAVTNAEKAAQVERTMTVLDMPADYKERLAQFELRRREEAGEDGGES